MFEVHAAVLSYAKASIMNWFGEGVEKKKRIYLMGRIETDVWLSLTEEIKDRK